MSSKEFVGKIALQPVIPLGLAILLGCGDGLEPVPFQGISGTVTYIGAPPDSTDWVRLAVYKRLPGTVLELLSFVAVSDTLFLGAPEVAYAIALEPGAYEWVTAVWKRAGEPISLTSLKVAGWYRGDDLAGGPLPFVVEADSETADIDVIVDFTNMLGPQQAVDSLGAFR